jgi:MoxR-like ATPase
MIIRQQVQGMEIPTINQVVSTSEIINGRTLVKQVYMDEKVEQYIIDIVFVTRNPTEYGLGKLRNLISYGGSPRASINLALASKAHAFMQKRGFVIPDDVKAIAKDVLRHRIGLTYEAEAENINSEAIIDDILKAVQVP